MEEFTDCIPQPAVHRLDMDTSGLMVLARTKEAHRNISIQFQDRLVNKQYVAILDGLIEQDSGEIKLPFRLDVENRPHQIYDPQQGKMGISKWQKLAIENSKTRVLFTPYYQQNPPTSDTCRPLFGAWFPNRWRPIIR